MERNNARIPENGNSLWETAIAAFHYATFELFLVQPVSREEVRCEVERMLEEARANLVRNSI